MFLATVPTATKPLYSIVCFSTPLAAREVVTITTPLAPREPYMAAAEASFNTSIDRISEG